MGSPGAHFGSKLGSTKGLINPRNIISNLFSNYKKS